MSLSSTSSLHRQAWQWIRDRLHLPQEPQMHNASTEKKSLDLRTDLKLSVGSIIGSNHLDEVNLPKTNNQDAIELEISKEHAIIVVCDGCSGASNSEVGAKLLANVVLKAFKAHATSDKTADEILTAVQKTALEKLRYITSDLAIFDYSGTQSLAERDYARVETISRFFLATLIGAYCTPERCFIWGLGDGVYAYNQDGVPHVKVIRSLNNAPSYLAYNLLNKWPKDIPHKRLSVYQEFKQIPECIMVGSDGVEDLITLAGRNFPGSQEKIPSLEELLTNKRYLESPKTINQLLKRIQAGNTQSKRPLRDDTTLLVIGKRPEPMAGNTGISPDVTDMQQLKHPLPAVARSNMALSQPQPPQKTNQL